MNDEIKQMEVTYLVQLDNVRMSHFLQNFNLPGNPLYVLLIVDLLLFKDFYSHLDTSFSE